MSKQEVDLYRAGMVPQGARVIMVVSQGPYTVAPRNFTTMPAVSGKNQGAALEEISKSALQAQVVYDYHADIRKGSVSAQLPLAGTSLPTGSEAVVLVSSGAPLNQRTPVPLPDVVGMTENEAIATLDKAGLAPQVMYQQSQTTAAGVVIEQLPDRRTFAQEKKSSKTALWVVLGILAALIIATAVFFIANQKSDADISVPNVVGMAVGDATTQIESSGLTVGTVTEVPAEDAKDAKVEAGDVVSTDPAADTKVKKGSAVNLTVVKADDGKSAIPNVVGKTQAAARAALEAAGFTVTDETAYSDTVKEGKVIAQDPSAGTDAAKDSTVMITVSLGKEDQPVSVPDVTGLSESAARSTLEAAGFKVKVSEGTSTDVESGNVISQVPDGGNTAPEKSTVTIVVSTGSGTTDAGDQPAE